MYCSADTIVTVDDYRRDEYVRVIGVVEGASHRHERSWRPGTGRPSIIAL